MGISFEEQTTKNKKEVCGKKRRQVIKPTITEGGDNGVVLRFGSIGL